MTRTSTHRGSGGQEQREKRTASAGRPLFHQLHPFADEQTTAPLAMRTREMRERGREQTHTQHDACVLVRSWSLACARSSSGVRTAALGLRAKCDDRWIGRRRDVSGDATRKARAHHVALVRRANMSDSAATWDGESQHPHRLISPADPRSAASRISSAVSIRASPPLVVSTSIRITHAASLDSRTVGVSVAPSHLPPQLPSSPHPTDPLPPRLRLRFSICDPHWPITLFSGRRFLPSPHS